MVGDSSEPAVPTICSQQPSSADLSVPCHTSTNCHSKSGDSSPYCKGCVTMVLLTQGRVLLKDLGVVAYACSGCLSFMAGGLTRNSAASSRVDVLCHLAFRTMFAAFDC